MSDLQGMESNSRDILQRSSQKGRHNSAAETALVQNEAASKKGIIY
jgi:hypothetical protein